jgi:hypothetical protein
MEMTNNTHATTHYWLAQIGTTGRHGGWGHQRHSEQPTPSQQWTH